MGLFDKLKGIVKGALDAVQPQQPAQQQAQQPQAFDRINADGSTSSDAGAAANPEILLPVDSIGAVGAEPCTLERYAEIGGAQSAWAQQGRDVNQMLQQQFGMNALDWSNISQYWSGKFAGDYRIAVQYRDLLTKYEEQYKAQGRPP